MLGPILRQELLVGYRRKRLHVLRWCYAGWLVLQIFWLYMAELFTVAAFYGRSLDCGDFAEFARGHAETFATQHFLLLVLATPALTAGALTDEKTRGTLQYLLTTDLRPSGILLDKLLARSAQVGLLALTGLPVLCFLGVFGGLDVAMLLSGAVASVLLVFAFGSASLLASVLCRHTRDAVLAVYAVGAALFFVGRELHGWLADLEAAAGTGEGAEAPSLLRWLVGVLDCFDPLHPLGSGSWMLADAGERGRRLLASLAAWGSLGTVCLAIAAWRLRPAYLRYLEARDRKAPRWWRARRGPVGDDPIRWKERHVEGIAPLAVLRSFPGWLGLLLVVLATTAASGAIFFAHSPTAFGEWWRLLTSLDFQGLSAALVAVLPAGNAFYWQGIVVMLLAVLVVGARCSGAVTGERERGTWEALLLTPLETRELVRGKYWGVLGAAVPYLIAYAVPAVLISALCGVGALVWTLICLGVTCLGVAFGGAAGLWCSARSRNSWRSLLGTLGFVYLSGMLVSCVGGTVVAFFLFLISAFLILPAGGGMGGVFWFMQAQQFAICLCLAGLFVLAAWRLLGHAEWRLGNAARARLWRKTARDLARWERNRLVRSAPPPYADEHEGEP